MKRTDSDGATVDNKFTNGNPSLGIPATTVDDNWLNTIQEEVSLFIEAQGITLDQTGVDVTQLQQAINAVVGSGVSIPDFSISNNVASASDVTNLVFNKANVKSATMVFDINRRVDGSELNEMGKIHCVYKPESDEWDLTYDSQFDDAGVIFTIDTATGQVQYTSSDFAGANYSGTLKVKNIITVAI